MRLFDPWKSPLCTCPLKYSLQPYTGCTHRCLYCYASAYIGYRPSKPKRKFIVALESDLRKANKNIPVSMSNSSDPYPPEEEYFKLTHKALKLLARYGFKVLVVTKSDLVVRDLEVLRSMRASVSMTITTLDDHLARRMEPYAPPPSRRLEALERLAKSNIPVSMRLDPIVPGLNDDPAMLEDLLELAVKRGIKHVVASTYKVRPDNFKRMILAFPDKADLWRRLYFKEGTVVRGYRYLPKRLRVKLLRPVVEAARRLGITYATCREGLTDRYFFKAPSCDGSHLIKESGD